MAFDLEEQEKIDQLKAWWAKFGGLVTGILTIILLAFAGYYAWNWYKNYQSSQALGYYDIVYSSANAQSSDTANVARLKEALNVLQKDYKGTAYPARASLVASKFLVSNNDLSAAQEALRWVIEQSDEVSLVLVARLQLSAILMNQQKYDEALAQVNNPPEYFSALFLDRQGDILLAQGNKEAAIKAWNASLQAPNIESTYARIIQMKLSVLGGQ